MKSEEKQAHEYEGGCLCDETTYVAKGEPTNPHLCSCTMCQKSSGAPTVAWVEFPLKDFKWTGNQPNMYRSSEKTRRCSCKNCGGLLGTLNDGYPNVCITIATLRNPSLIVPGKQHSYKESAPSWWFPKVSNKSFFLEAIETIRNNKTTSALATACFFAVSGAAVLYRTYYNNKATISGDSTPRIDL